MGFRGKRGTTPSPKCSAVSGAVPIKQSRQPPPVDHEQPRSTTTGLIEPQQTGDAFVLTHGTVDPEGNRSITVRLTEPCTPHALGATVHRSQPCWSAQFDLPVPGTVALSETNGALSGTTVLRVPLTTPSGLDNGVFASNGSAGLSFVIGQRAAAVHGSLDRSGLRFFTAVPKIYRDLFVTTETTDYREISSRLPLSDDRPWGAATYFDWEHGASFPPPAVYDPTKTNTQHPLLPQRRWHPRERAFTYFADWTTDTVTARWTGDEPSSGCLEASQLFASPRTFEFTGAGLPTTEPTVRDARLILKSYAPGPGRLIEVSPRANASGDFKAALLPAPP